MPQQPNDTPYKLRLTYVWQVLEKLGRASAQEISAHVARRLGLSEETASHKRNIYRDLRQLIDAGEIGVDHFLPDGQKIDTTEEATTTANFRAEYFSLNQTTRGLGEGLLAHFGAELHTPDRMIVTWRVASFSERMPEGSLAILLSNPSGEWLTLFTETAQRPLQLVVARSDNQTKGQSHFDSVRKNFGRRAALLRININSISRALAGVRDGHVILELGANVNEISVRDLGSSSGTMVARLPENFMPQLFQAQSSGSTSSTLTLESLTRFHFSNSGSEPTPYQPPFIVLIGSYFFIVSLH